MAVGDRVGGKVSFTVHRSCQLETGTAEQIGNYTRAAGVVQRPWELATGGYLPSLALTVCGFTFAHFARYRTRTIFLTRTLQGCNDAR